MFYRSVPALSFSPCPIGPPDNLSRESPDVVFFFSFSMESKSALSSIHQAGLPCPDVATAFPTSSASRPSLKFSPSGLWKFDLTIIDGQWSYLWYKSLTEIWRWVVDWKETCLWCSNVSWSPFLLPLQDPQCHSSTPGKGISKKWKWCDGESQCDAQ